MLHRIAIANTILLHLLKPNILAHPTRKCECEESQYLMLVHLHKTSMLGYMHPHILTPHTTLIEKRNHLLFRRNHHNHEIGNEDHACLVKEKAYICTLDPNHILTLLCEAFTKNLTTFFHNLLLHPSTTHKISKLETDSLTSWAHHPWVVTTYNLSTNKGNCLVMPLLGPLTHVLGLLGTSKYNLPLSLSPFGSISHL